MNCGDARRLFGAYWDDEITLAERDWLESHFASCAGCRSEYETLAHTIELVSSLPRAEVRPDLAERALARARRATAAPDRLPVVTPRWIPLTATAALLAIAVTMSLQWMGITPGHGPTPRSEVATVREPVLLGAGDVRATPSTVPDGRGVEVGGEADDQLAGGVPDSLFDHSADVEFILDPVTLRKGRAHAVLRLSPDVQGEKAVITF
jgi:anti-sigma factor RsiW